MLKTIINWLLRDATFRLFISQVPIGRRLGGYDIPGVIDRFIVLEITSKGRNILLGYFQAS